MEAGLQDAALRMYHGVSGKTRFSVSDVCDEFSNAITDDLEFDSPHEGKVEHPETEEMYFNISAFENEFRERDIVEILAGV